jgi:hypothetical protein
MSRCLFLKSRSGCLKVVRFFKGFSTNDAGRVRSLISAPVFYIAMALK